MPGVAGLVIVWFKWPVTSGRARHDGDGTAEGTVKRPVEELGAGRFSYPSLCGAERFVGWIGGEGLFWCLRSSHSVKVGWC